MKTRIVFALFAVFAILFSLGACTSSPKVSNFYMATDEQGLNKTSSFAPANAFNLFFDVSGIPNGTTFEARWYVLNMANRDPNTPFQIKDLTNDFTQTRIYFHLTNTGNWPVAQYRVDVYMSGNLVGQVQFSVSQ